MALTTVDTSPATQRPHEEKVTLAVRELQGLKFAVVSGGAAAAQLNLAGIDTDDVLVAAIYLPISGGNVTSAADLLAEASIPAAGKVAFSTTVTTGGKVLVGFFHLPT